jgi:hypothetical protein
MIHKASIVLEVYSSGLAKQHVLWPEHLYTKEQQSRWARELPSRATRRSIALPIKIMTRRLFGFVVLFTAIVMMSGCGTSAHSASNNNSNPVTPPSTGGVNAPTVVNLAGGQAASGMDIAVSLPASSPPPNAQALGATTSSAGSANNTGTIVSRGSTVTVLLFGPGLSSSMQVSISGPSDIGISQIRGVQSTTGIPGIAFQAAIASNAALGARTVILQATNGDVTTFTGGLEIQ